MSLQGYFSSKPRPAGNDGMTLITGEDGPWGHTAPRHTLPPDTHTWGAQELRNEEQKVQHCYEIRFQD
ncbi:hypothetical protein ACOMHN_003549 [Nucella lapillus]